MKFKKLGNTDLKVSLICLGTMTWGEQNTQEEGFEQMDYALESCLLYTSDAADEWLRVDLGGRRIIKKTFFQAEDGIRDSPMSRGLGDVYKRQFKSKPHLFRHNDLGRTKYSRRRF